MAQITHRQDEDTIKIADDTYDCRADGVLQECARLSRPRQHLPLGQTIGRGQDHEVKHLPDRAGPERLGRAIASPPAALAQRRQDGPRPVCA